MDEHANSLRTAALSLLLQQAMQRARPHGQAAAHERLGHDLSALFDGAFGGHPVGTPPPGLGGSVAGMEGLLHALREHGLGKELESWIGPGPARPITPQQAAMVLEMGTADRLAREAGVDRHALLAEAAARMPEFVHRMMAHAEGRAPSR